MRILLATRHANTLYTPLALLYLKASLVSNGVVDADAVTIAEFDRDADAQAIADALIAAAPDVIGLSCYVWNIGVLQDAARLVRAALPAARIVMGGPEVGPVADAVLERNPHVDAVVRSEGEVPVCDLVRCWRDGGAMADVAGLTWRDGARVVRNADAPIVRDLNRVASPHLANYVDHTGRTVCIETQRGCVFTCSFCFYNKDYSIRNRRFDLDRVKDELRFWLAQDVHEIYLMDPVFNLNAARAKEICRFIAEHNHRRIPFHTEVWAEFIDDEMASLFAEANFRFIEVGLQTSNYAVLEIVERRFKRQEFINGLGHLKAHGLLYELQLIAGLPGETLDTLRASLDFAASFLPPDLSVFTLMILPGTELSRKAESLGIAYDPEPPYHIRSHPSMPAADIARARDIAEAARTLWQFQTMRLLARATGGSYAELVEDWMMWQDGISTYEQARALLPAFVHRWADRRPVDGRFFTASAAAESRLESA
ncbi:MAG: radical SAM protein [Gemmatimonadaceae bacterium]|nr:radical SAM protein [Gemmatimonadaceae bacterium]